MDNVRENLSERCPTCGRYTSFEENYGYMHNDDPYHPFTGAYCDEACVMNGFIGMMRGCK